MTHQFLRFPKYFYRIFYINPYDYDNIFIFYMSTHVIYCLSIQIVYHNDILTLWTKITQSPLLWQQIINKDDFCFKKYIIIDWVYIKEAHFLNQFHAMNEKAKHKIHPACNKICIQSNNISYIIISIGTGCETFISKGYNKILSHCLRYD